MSCFGIEFETLGRKPGQQASSQRENYLSFILDRVPVGIMQTGLDGRYVYANSHFCKLTVRSERHEGLLSVCVDLTDRMRAEAQKNVLIEELNHRVKNTLASVQSLAAVTMKHTSSPKVFYKAFSSRLIALSAAHNLLTRGTWERAPLHDRLAVELQPYASREHDRATITGPPVNLSTGQTISLGIVIHELATNAAKYGALSAPNGRISISWTITADHGKDWLCIDWYERGGPSVKPPIRRGFGWRLIERSITDNGGRFEPIYAEEGFRCTILIPV